MSIAAITLIDKWVLVPSVACIAKVWSDKDHVLMATEAAGSSTLCDDDFSFLDFDSLSTFRAVCDSTLRLTVCLDAGEAEASRRVSRLVTAAWHLGYMRATNADCAFHVFWVLS